MGFFDDCLITKSWKNESYEMIVISNYWFVQCGQCYSEVTLLKFCNYPRFFSPLMCLHYQISIFILLNHKIIKIRLRLDNNFGHIMQSNNSVVGRLSDHFIIPIFLELMKYISFFKWKKNTLTLFNWNLINHSDLSSGLN